MLDSGGKTTLKSVPERFRTKCGSKQVRFGGGREDMVSLESKMIPRNLPEGWKWNRASYKER